MNSQSSITSAHADQSELEARLATLEGGAAAYTFVSGQTTVGAVLDLLDVGAHVILAAEMRGTRYRAVEDIRRRTSGVGFELCRSH